MRTVNCKHETVRRPDIGARLPRIDRAGDVKVSQAQHVASTAAFGKDLDAQPQINFTLYGRGRGPTIAFVSIVFMTVRSQLTLYNHCLAW